MEGTNHPMTPIEPHLKRGELKTIHGSADEKASEKLFNQQTCVVIYCICDTPVWTLGSPGLRRKQVDSFLVLSRPREHRRDHLSLGDSGWVKLQPSSSERATFASPFCLESDRRTETRRRECQSFYWDWPECPDKGTAILHKSCLFLLRNWFCLKC